MTSTVPSVSLFDDDQSRAERLLLDLADYIYAHTALKPMSKTLFVISRCLLVADSHSDATPQGIAREYARVRATLGDAAPEDDYSLETILSEAAPHLERILGVLGEVLRLTVGSDSLGLAFNSLLRGKIEGGEGLGTYLTPEEVVRPMVSMALDSFTASSLDRLLNGGALFGDICGGTGRFVFAMQQALQQRGVDRGHIEKGMRLYDQSRLAVDLARINFVIEGMRPHFSVVADSLTDADVAKESQRYALVATNPPFGAAKYHLDLRTLGWLTPDVLKTVAQTGRGGAVDPAVLFLLKNLELLCDEGVMAIVLPDGIARAAWLRSLIESYERHANAGVEKAAAVSLPATTFALGGTVAKTSFLILRKTSRPVTSRPFSADSHHVGFLKRGNRRIVDPRGNDLANIAAAYAKHRSGVCSAGPGDFATADTHLGGRDTAERYVVADVAEAIRTRARRSNSGAPLFHVSILDVDDTGLINIVAASNNSPVSLGIACEPGDVILSCINPRHWRVAVIPDIPGEWTCSPEFLVLRSKERNGTSGLKLALALNSTHVRSEAKAAASGTSSSRQRVDKAAVLRIPIVLPRTDEIVLRTHLARRLEFYFERLKEARAYASLATPGGTFEYQA